MTNFRVWAPKAKEVSVVIYNDNETKYPMQSSSDGYFEATIENLVSPIDYMFCLDGDKTRPDPASKWQPNGVHGPSRIVASNDFQWEDTNWRGIDIKNYIIYELHVGTFTEAGTFDSLIEKIPYLQSLGITAVEIMPVAAFPGDRNWGYDGVYPYSTQDNYGGPHQLKKLVNELHKAGLAVILDVVYNHLGPEGNYLNDFGHYFTDHYKTPWGQAVNFDGPYSNHVRQYFINNALYWLTEFHFDALRLDAVHAIFDSGARHFLEELRTEFHEAAKKLNKQAYIIAESDLNDTRIINPIEKGGYALDAQWSDDFHHSLHTLLTNSKWGYFVDFGEIGQLAKSISDGFVYDGSYSNYRKRNFGSSSTSIPAEQFVVTMQNHDQIGNAARGKRLATFINPDRYKLASMLLFFSPYIPLLFMGQEFSTSTPFYYFTSFEDQELAQKVYEGYKQEMQVGSDEHFDVNPQSLDRFLQSKLNWQEVKNNEETLLFYKKLIAMRKEEPCLSNCNKELTQVAFDEAGKWLTIKRGDSTTASEALLVLNFAPNDQAVPIPQLSGNWLLQCANMDMSIEQSPRKITAADSSIPIKSWGACIYTKAS